MYVCTHTHTHVCIYNLQEWRKVASTWRLIDLSLRSAWSTEQIRATWRNPVFETLSLRKKMEKRKGQEIMR